MLMKTKAQAIAIVCLLVFSLAQSQDVWRTCVAVIDGDTIVLDGDERVRLIGVDTPETKDPRKPVQYFGRQAFEFTKRLVEGFKVRLDYELDKKDKYGRTLAYVYLEDGTFLNAEIIKQGYGFAYRHFLFKYYDD
jgi:micrococcal nuclease